MSSVTLADVRPTPPNRIPPGCETITPDMLPLIELNQQHIDRIVRAVPGGARNIQDVYSLSPLQEGILFHRRLDERSDTYVLSTLLEVRSAAQLGPLIDALQKVIDRHDVLRSCVLWEELPKPVQVVHRQVALPVERLAKDLGSNADEQLREFIKPGREIMDLRKAPLVKLQVVVDAGGDKLFAVLRVHHLLCDHQSLRIAVDEAMACLKGKELPPTLAYRHYVTEALENASGKDAEEFFRAKLGDVEEPTAPFGLLEVHGDGAQIEDGSLEIDLSLARRIRNQARCHGVSAARIFHAAWGLVVARASGKDDVVYGTVLSAIRQRRIQDERMLGMAVNTLPLRLRLQATTARELVDQTHRELEELVKHRHVSLSLAQRCSGISGGPLFTAILNYRHSVPEHKDEATGADGIQVLARGEAWTNYPVALTVDDLGEGFTLTAQSLRPINTHRVLGYLQAAVQSLVTALEWAPQTPAMALSILPPGERQQINLAFNLTQVPCRDGELLHELVEEQAAHTPDAVAVVCANEQLTYAQLNRKANLLASMLRARGIEPEDRVALCLERSVEMIVAMLGVLKAGGCYVPLDPAYPAERLRYMLADSAPVAVLVHERTQHAVPTSEVPVIFLETIDDERDPGSSVDQAASAPELKSRHLAYVIYTSGSTGTPKGVMVEHRSVVNLVRWHCAAFDVHRSSICSSVAAVGFDAAVWEIWPPLSVGATLVLAPPDVSGDAEAMLSWWENERLDISFLPTPIAELALSRDRRHPQLRKLLVGGDRLRHRPMRTTCSLVNNYGPTENTVVATSGVIDVEDDVLHIGRPIWNMQVHILDGNLQTLPIGVAGEIYVGGTGVARGYLNRPDLTADRFIADPLGAAPGARLYRTGDLGRWRGDGTVEYLGRNDHQVKIRGFRIELCEIEAQLAKHEQVKEAVVIAREDTPGEKRLVAYVTGHAPGRVTAKDLRMHLQVALPPYMVPSAFMVLTRLPLTQNGKLDQRALPAPDADAYASQEYEAPLGSIETTVAAIWQEVLQVERVGRRDSFFDLGGHSLLATRAISRIHDLLDVDLPLRELLNAATVEQVAGRIEADRNRRAEQEALQSDRLAQDLRQEIYRLQDDEVLARIAELERELDEVMSC